MRSMGRQLSDGFSGQIEQQVDEQAADVAGGMAGAAGGMYQSFEGSSRPGCGAQAVLEAFTGVQAVYGLQCGGIGAREQQLYGWQQLRHIRQRSLRLLQGVQDVRRDRRRQLIPIRSTGH